MANLINKKKGETVHMYAFTNMYLGEFTISDADKKSVTVVHKSGRTTKYSREDGKQIDAKTPRCANRITEEKEPEKKKPTAKKVKPKKTEETDEGAPAKTTKKKKVPAKKAKVEEPEEVETDDDDDEDYEEV